VESHIASMLTPENSSTFWNTVNKIDSVNLHRICESYFVDNLEKIVKTDDFLKLEKELVIRIFYSNSSRQRCENVVNPQAKKIPTALSVRAVTRWLTSNSPEFAKIDFANVVGKNKLGSTSNTPMELQ